MRSRSYLFALLLLLPLLTYADLPSCYRARCTHCRIQFIAQMCPETCTNCPVQTFGKSVNNAGTAIVHGQQTATVYRTAEHIQTLSQQDGQPQNAFAQRPPTYQAPTPQQQLIAPTSQTYQPQFVPSAQQPSQQFGQQLFNNQYSQFGNSQQFGGFPTPQPISSPSQYTGFQNLSPQPQAPTQFGGFVPPQQPQTPYNPFQPFLQPSFQAQQPTPYNPFTFPTLPPAATFAPFTHAPITLPTMGTFPTFPPFTQAPQPPIGVTQSPQQNNNYISPQVVNPQSPHQLYNTQQQSGQQTQYVNNQQIQTSYLQPARSNAIPTVQVQQPARSIDSAPVQLEKQAYIGKGAPPAFVNQCPKQPNWEPCISKELANERFHNCCQRLGEGCSQLCNYDQSLTTLQLAVLTGRCPIAKVADMMICASGYEDATSCCQAYGVFEPGFEHCRPYCNPAAGLPNDGMLAEKYKCLGKLSQIQRCFYVSQRP